MQLSDFFNASDKTVSNTAIKLDSLKQDLVAGSINADEYNDLVNDVTMVSEAERSGRTMSQLSMLNKTLQTLKALAIFVPL